MDKLLFVSMSGAKQSMIEQNIHANNLANVDTTGFKSDFAQARSMPVFGEYYPSRVYAMTERPGVDYSQGNPMITGREMDLAIEGEGWFTVVDSEGNEAFTRAGNLKLDGDGSVRTQAGDQIMGGGGPLILPDFEKLEIGVDGVISIRATGQGPEGLAEVGRLKLVNPPLGDIEKGKDGLYRRKDGDWEPPSVDVKVKTGVLESSNVNPVNELLEILKLQKQFEMQIKMMDKAETMDQTSSKLLQLS